MISNDYADSIINDHHDKLRWLKVMNLIAFQQYTISEEKPKEYRKVHDIMKRFDHYPYCMIGRVRHGKYKCYRCREEWRKVIRVDWPEY